MYGIEPDTVDALKRCPFCGNNAYITKSSPCDYLVECGTCAAQSAEYPTEQAAAAAWNRRV